MDKFEVVMIGNTAVGKTSMLSVLSKELKKYNKAGRLQLKPTSSELDILEGKWNELLKQVENNDEFQPVTAKIDGTAEPIEHPFEFRVEGKKKCDVVFVDTPGIFTRKRNKELIEKVNHAFGVFCVVDAAVLMECAESRNNELNCPAFVHEILEQVYSDGDKYQPTFIAFILTKCEKYMSTKSGRDRLAEKFQSSYGDVIDMLKSPNIEQTPKIYMLAIQTMGSVQFAELDENNEPVFMVVEKSLTPKDCAYPLVLLLRNLITVLDRKKGWFTRLKELLRIENPLTEYLAVIEKSVKKPALYKAL